MKTELLVFSRAASLAYDDGIISASDYARICNSLQGKGIGFVADLDDLAQCVRSGLSTGTFQLTERLNKVFRRPSKRCALPVFLLGVLKQVFHTNGVLRVQYDGHMAAFLLTFLSSLKRIDPPRKHVSLLSAKVWNTLELNFQDSEEIKKKVLCDPSKRDVLSGIRDHFQRLLPDSLGDPTLAFGPGHNIDRYPAVSSMDWVLDDRDNNVPSHLVPYFRVLQNHSAYVPRLGRVRRTVRIAGGISHRIWYTDGSKRKPCSYPDVATMKCSAQPKSYKAYRGVGVMHIARMSLQLSLQRWFYRVALTENMPLKDQNQMSSNLKRHFFSIGTIDLSSASDRLYWWLLDLVGIGNVWYEAARATRTRVLALPGQFIQCASPVMGEAITFPLMSCFFTAVALHVCDTQGWGHELVRVYGDDIQTPHYHETISLLETLGSKPSREKSYPPTSYFKESCEGHYCYSPGDDTLVDARPAYIPSGVLFGNVRRGRIARADAYKHLVLAKDAFLRSSYVSLAAAHLVQQYAIPYLPKVPYSSPHLGFPTYVTSDRYELLWIRKNQSVDTLTRAGSARQALRHPDISPDHKLSKKMEYKLMVQSISNCAIRDSMELLEYHVLHAAAEVSDVRFKRRHGFAHRQCANAIEEKRGRHAALIYLRENIDPLAVEIYIDSLLERM